MIELELHVGLTALATLVPLNMLSAWTYVLHPCTDLVGEGEREVLHEL